MLTSKRPPTPAEGAALGMVMRPLGDGRYEVTSRIVDGSSGKRHLVTTFGHINVATTIAHHLDRLGFTQAREQGFGLSVESGAR